MVVVIVDDNPEFLEDAVAKLQAEFENLPYIACSSEKQARMVLDNVDDVVLLADMDLGPGTGGRDGGKAVVQYAQRDGRNAAGVVFTDKETFADGFRMAAGTGGLEDWTAVDKLAFYEEEKRDALRQAVGAAIDAVRRRARTRSHAPRARRAAASAVACLAAIGAAQAAAVRLQGVELIATFAIIAGAAGGLDWVVTVGAGFIKVRFLSKRDNES